MAEGILDIALCAAVLWLAWRALSGPDLFRSVILFIAFGLLLSIVWVRLAAPDVALAEAAIGAGLSGALLLDAVSGMQGSPARAPSGRRRTTMWRRASLPGLAVIAGFLGWAVLLALRVPANTPAPPGALDATGMPNRVTAVLLNVRAYDTLLEVVVLLLAAVGVLTLRRGAPLRLEPRGGSDPVLRWTVRLLLPVLALAAAHLVLRGTHAPGGAFQAGALLGGAGVLAFLAGFAGPTLHRAGLRGTALLLGPLCFLVVAAVPVLTAGELLHLREGAADAILLLELAIGATTAATLGLLFVAARPVER